MTAQTLVVYLGLCLAVSIGANVVLTVVLRRTRSIFRNHFLDLEDKNKALEEKNRALEDRFENCSKDRSFFLAQWKIFEPKTVELTVLCEHWEGQTHHWRKKCWWLSDKMARERDGEVVRAAAESAAMNAVGAAFGD